MSPRKMGLSPRLMALAREIPHGCRVADVGCDHARLLVWLAQAGKAPSLIGTEISRGPWERARLRVARHRLTQRVSLRLCDGLEGVSPEEVDAVVLAGMGGETICGILQRTPWLVDKLLLTQPMTRRELVRKTALSLGFYLCGETQAEERGRQYTIFKWKGRRHVTTVKDIFAFCDSWAPVHTAEEDDNCGLLAGKAGAEVKRVLVTLDITLPVIREAVERGATLIVAHHPVIYKSPLRSVTDETPEGRRMIALLEAGLAAICMHTNVDKAVGGVNDTLADRLGLRDVTPIAGGLMRMGTVEDCSLREWAHSVGSALGCQGMRLYDAGKPVSRVAMAAGGFARGIAHAWEQGCDTFLSADIAHAFWLAGADMGVNVIDAGHFLTENVVCKPWTQKLREAFPGVEFWESQGCREPFSYWAPPKSK